jgi:hypothetical protein
MESLEALQGRYAGQRCFFLGNGPSINQQDLSLLQHEHVWAANRAYLLFKKIQWRPSFYVVKDRIVIENSQAALQALVGDLPRTIFFFPYWAFEESRISAAENTCGFNTLNDPGPPHSTFSFDAVRGIVPSRTVATTTLQLAIWLGFNPIVLTGCDMSYKQTDAAELERRSEGGDLDHFDPSYLANGKAWEVPDVAGMLEELGAARLACDSRGIRVLNATCGGRLEAFPRTNYDELFR